MIVSRAFTCLAAWGLVASVAGMSFAQQQPAAQPGAQNQPGVRNQNDQPQPGVSNRTPQRPGTPTDANPQRPFTENQTAGAGGFVLASQVVGLPVQSSEGRQIGTMADVLLTVHAAAPAQTTGENAAATQGNVQANVGNTQANVGVDAVATSQPPGSSRWMGTSTYALINVDAFAEGRVAILPWDLLTYADGAFIIGFDVNRLGEVPSVMQGDPRLLEDTEWAQHVDGFFQDDLRQIQRARPDLENLTPDPQPTTPRQPGVDRADPTPGTPGATPPRTPGNTPERTPPPRTSQPGTNTPQPPAAPGAPGNPAP